MKPQSKQTTIQAILLIDFQTVVYAKRFYYYGTMYNFSFNLN
jgi:hypothetical protein